jgi:trypsin-like peptidase
MRRMIILITLLAVSGRSEDVFVKTTALVKKATIPVVCAFQDNANSIHVAGSAGTGFFVNGDGYFVTAAHVIDSFPKISTPQRPCDVAIYVPINGWEVNKESERTNIKFFRVPSCRINRSLDLAVCHPLENPFEDREVSRYVSAIRLDSFFSYGDGTPVAFTGFPLNSVRPITSQGILASYRSVERELVIDRNGWPGASGSPVYLKNGKLVGMIIEAGFDRGAGLSYGRPSEFIADFLRQEKVSFK